MIIIVPGFRVVLGINGLVMCSNVNNDLHVVKLNKFYPPLVCHSLLAIMPCGAWDLAFRQCSLSIVGRAVAIWHVWKNVCSLDREL